MPKKFLFYFGLWLPQPHTLETRKWRRIRGESVPIYSVCRSVLHVSLCRLSILPDAYVVLFWNDAMKNWCASVLVVGGHFGILKISVDPRSPRSFLASSTNMEAHKFFIASFQYKTTYASGGMDKWHRPGWFSNCGHPVGWREGVLRDNNDGVVHTGKGEWLN